jgi:hypothetical protein
MPVSRVRAFHIAEFYEIVGRANQYLVKVDAGGVTDDELAEAKQILIGKQNAGPQKGLRYANLERALDLVEAEEKRRQGEARLLAGLAAVEAPKG